MPEKESKDTIDMGWSALTGAMEAVKDASPHSLVLLNKTLVGVLTLIAHVKTVCPARYEFLALVGKLKASENFLNQYDETNKPTAMNEFNLKNLKLINRKVRELMLGLVAGGDVQDIIDLTSGLITFLEDYFNFRTTLSSKGHVLSVSLSHDGTRIASGSSDNTVQVWDVETGLELIKPLKGHTDSVSCVAFSRDGTLIVSSSYDKTIRLWDGETGMEIMNLRGHTDRVTFVAFSPDCTHIISSSYDTTIRMWDARTGQAKVFDGHTDWVMSLGFSVDMTRIVSGSKDMTIRLWDARTGLEVMKLVGHTDIVRSVNFSPGGTRIVSGSDDKTIRIWDGATGGVINLLTGHSGRVTSVLFSPDATRILSGSEDKTIRLWDARTGKKVMKPFEGHRDCVRSVSFWTDGSRILSGSDDRTIRMWDIRTGVDILEWKRMEEQRELEERRWYEETRKAKGREEQRRLEEEMRQTKEVEEQRKDEERKRAEEQRRREEEMRRAMEREEETDLSDGGDDDDERLGPDHLRDLRKPVVPPKSQTPGYTLTPAMPRLAGQQNIASTSTEKSDNNLHEDTKVGGVVLTSVHPHILPEDDYVPFTDPSKLTMTILLSESCSSTPSDSSDGDDDALDFDHLQSGPSIIPPNPHPKSETSASLTLAMPQHLMPLVGQQNIPPTSIDTSDKGRYEDTKVSDVVLKSTGSHSLAEDAYVPFVDPTKLTTRISLSETRGSSTPTNSSDDDEN